MRERRSKRSEAKNLFHFRRHIARPGRLRSANAKKKNPQKKPFSLIGLSSTFKPIVPQCRLCRLGCRKTFSGYVTQQSAMVFTAARPAWVPSGSECRATSSNVPSMDNAFSGASPIPPSASRTTSGRGVCFRRPLLGRQFPSTRSRPWPIPWQFRDESMPHRSVVMG